MSLLSRITSNPKIGYGLAGVLMAGSLIGAAVVVPEMVANATPPAATSTNGPQTLPGALKTPARMRTTTTPG